MAHDAKELYETIDRVLALAKEAAPDAEVLVRHSTSRDANTRFACNEMTSDGDVEEAILELRIAFGQRHAQATTNQLDDASLHALVQRAIDMARVAPLDPEAMPVLGPQSYAKVPQAFDAETAALGADARARAAAQVISVVMDRKLQGAGFYEHSGWTTAIKTSAGLAADHMQTDASLTVTARTVDGAGSGWAIGASDRVSEVDPGAIARVAVDKALRSVHPRSLDPGRYTVVLEPAAVGELLGFFAEALDARSADEGRSFFAKPGGGTRLGEKIFADAVTLRSDPTSPRTPEAPFDPEGFPLVPITWIDRGKLENLHYSRYWAQKQGKTPTGDHWVYHLTGGTEDSDGLIRGVKRGLLITRFWYVRWVDRQSLLTTGLTRDGVFLIEDGQVMSSVNNFRFNESPVTMLRNVEAMTRQTVRVPGWRTMRVPAIRTSGFNLASRSDAV